MKFFIDTANLDQIREAYDMGVLDGVTTNPSLMAKEGIKGVDNQRKHYVEICNIVQGDVSAEVIFHFQRDSYQLHISIFRRTSIAGCQGRSYLCFSVCRASG